VGIVSSDVLVGEKAIAEHIRVAHGIEVSVRSVRRWARRERDPLPLFRFLRSIQAKATAIDDWIERQRRHVSASSTVRKRPNQTARRSRPRQSATN